MMSETPLEPLEYLVSQPPLLMDFGTRIAWMYGWLMNDASRDFDTVISTLEDLMDNMDIDYGEFYDDDN